MLKILVSLIFSWCFRAINLINKLNYRTIIITNQACVGKLIISEKRLNQITIL